MKVIWKTLLVVMGIVLLLVCVYAGWGLLSGNAVDLQIADLRAAGSPTQWSDLKVQMPPEEDNGAALLDEAVELLMALPQQGGPRDFLTLREWQRWGEDDVTSARAALDALVEPIALIEEALSRPQIVYQVPDDPLGDLGGPSLMGVRDVVMLWIARARYHRLVGEHELATRELAEALRLGECSSPPSILGLMIRVSVADLTLEEIQAALRAAPPGVDSMRSTLDPLLAALEDPQLLVLAYEQERVFGLEIHRRLESGESLDGMETIVPGWAASPFLRINMESYLAGMQEMIEISALSYVDGNASALALNDRLENLGVIHVLTKLALPGLMRVFESMAKYRARARMARVSLAACALHQETGAWPEDLETLVPMVGASTILDTLNDQPFSLDLTSTGPRLRSAWIAENPGDVGQVAGMTWELGEEVESEIPR